jgi:Late competence development protein ComFB
MGQSQNTSPSQGSVRAYQNIMENLVHQEIQRQMQTMPRTLLEYIEVSEVATFALNRLPPLYASSQRGKELQAEKGQNKLKQEVATAVRQALAAVQRDPLRSSKPLPSNRDPRYQIAEEKLAALEEFLRVNHVLDPSIPKLNWDNVNLAIARALKKTAQKGLVSRGVEQLLMENDYSNGHQKPSAHDWTDPKYH